MAFETFNEQAAAKTGRYLTARVAPSGVTFTTGEVQMIRWQFPGLVIAISQAIPFGQIGGTLTVYQDIGGVLSRG